MLDTNYTLDKETIIIMKNFKTVINKQIIANRLAKETVEKGLKENSKVLKHYYDKNEPADVTVACISFGLMQLMEEDFYIIKEVLGYDYIMNILDNTDNFLKLVK